MKEFGKKLKSARVGKGMSQRSLGLALGLSDKTISSYESSRSFPNLDVLRKIAQILDKPVEFFISPSAKVDITDILQSIQKKQKEISRDIERVESLLKQVE
jgi:transcriptional regulator with XRE-family HTH domain